MGSFQVPHGDPAGLRAAAKQFSRLAGDHAALATSVAHHVQQASDGWKGGFADRFRQCAQAVHTRFQPVSHAAMSVSHELNTYAAALESAQHNVSSLNTQADSLSRQHQQHADPAAKAQAMSQLGQQAAAAASSANRAAQVCASRIAAAKGQLGGALPDIMSLQQLQDEVQRASAKLKKEDPSVWEKIFGKDGLLRTWDDRLSSPLDALGADLVVAHFIERAKNGTEMAEAAREFAREMPSLMEADFGERFGSVISDLRDGSLTESDLAAGLRDFAESWNWAAKANSAFEAAGEAASAGGGLAKGASVTLEGMAVVGDAYTIWKPSDGGAMRWVDRGAAIANAGAAGIGFASDIAAVNMADWIPGVGEVVGVGTGLFLAGDWAYHTFKPFHDFCNDVGHDAVSVVHDVGSFVSSIF